MKKLKSEKEDEDIILRGIECKMKKIVFIEM